MQERHVDARGLGCPKPVVLTRQAMLQAGVEKVHVVVDNDVSAENVQRLATSQGWEATLEKTAEETHLTLTKQVAPQATAAAEQPATSREPRSHSPDVVVLVSSNLFGTGQQELGRILMRAFIKTLREMEPLPGKVIFANSGVRLTTKGSDLIDDLRALESGGVEILSCGTCLDYYGLLDSLEVGVKSNMYEIASSLVAAGRVVRP